jgi:hypothetical protein
MSQERKQKFKAFLGILIVTYTPSRVISRWRDLHDIEMVQRYAVLGIDEASVAITTFGTPQFKNAQHVVVEDIVDLKSTPQIRHIHFVGNRYWECFGRNREFFIRSRHVSSKGTR